MTKSCTSDGFNQYEVGELPEWGMGSPAIAASSMSSILLEGDHRVNV